MIQGAIFDVDGTLLDSMFLWDDIGERYLRSLGCEPKEDLNETFQNMSIHQAACYCQEVYGVTLSLQEIMDGINRLVEKAYREEVQLKPGMETLLKRLKEEGVQMCIATATDRYLIEAALKRCGVRDFFSEIFTCTNVGHGKDEPVIYREALGHLNTEKDKTVIFEDALYAAQTAKKDGFWTVGVYDEHEAHQTELKELVDCYLTDYHYLEAFWAFASQR